MPLTGPSREIRGPREKSLRGAQGQGRVLILTALLEYIDLSLNRYSSGPFRAVVEGKIPQLPPMWAALATKITVIF